MTHSARTPLQTALFTCLSIAALAPSPAAHDGDGKMRDRRPRVEAARGGAGSGSANLAIASDTISFPHQNVELLAWLTCRDFGAQNETGNSCNGYTSPSGREYGIIGLSRGTAFVEVTDPGEPVVVAFISGPESLWRDMKVFGSTCYMVSEAGSGIQVADMSQIDAGVVTLVTQVTTGGSGATHTVGLDAASGFLYRCGGSGLGLRIYDLSNPLNPTFVASWSDRYVHECQVVTYTSGPYAGKQIAFCCAGLNSGQTNPSLDILDVTNKSAIVLVKRFFYSGAAFSHQGWLTPDRHYFYLDDELDENGSNLMKTRVIDVSNLSNPVEHPTFTTGSHAIDHNLYVVGNRIFESNYRSGLHVFDNSNPLVPVQIGYFDTWPDDEAAHFNSLWNNYPFFASGTVIGSDIEKGLFVWRVGAPELDFAFASGAPTTFAPAGENVALTISESVPGTLATASPKLHVGSGATWTSIDLVPGPAGAWLAPFPPTACGTAVSWYVTARTNAGVTWAWPRGAPTIAAQATAATALTLVLSDPLDASTGWSGVSAGDTATSGRWDYGAPNWTQAQPGEDHTPVGTNCWFTGQGAEWANTGVADVDGGTTTLTSPRYDLSALAQPVIRYWRWFSNHLGATVNSEDALHVEVSNDDGATWHTVETVGPLGPETDGGWIAHQFRVADIVPPSANVRVRWIAEDILTASNVEAAIDDVAILDVGCPPPPPVVYCSAKQNSQGCLPQIGWSGTPSVSAPSAFVVTCGNVLSNKPGMMIYGHARAAVPFQGATRCVAAPVHRTPIVDSAGNPPPVDCSGSYAFDMSAWIGAGSDPSLVIGAQVDCQFWYRDPLDPAGFGSGLSDALEFTILP